MPVGAVRLLFCLSALLVARSAFAQNEHLAGRKVMTIKWNTEFKEGGTVTFRSDLGKVYKVDQVNGRLLRLVGDGRQGWVKRSDVVPYDQAIEHFSRLVEQEPSSTNYRNRAFAWQAKGKFYFAQCDLNAGFRCSWNAMVAIARGLTWENKGEYDRAIVDYTEAIRLDPKDANAYNLRGSAWENKGEYDRAISDYTEVIRLDPKYALAYYNRSNAWRNKGEYDRATAYYSKAIRLNPKNAWAYNNRGIVWRNKGENDRAIADHNEAIRLNPKDAWGYNSRGKAWRSKGEYDRAIADHNEAIRLDPKDVYAYINRGNVWDDKGEYDRAIADYNEAIRLDPKQPWTFYNRGNAWGRKGEYDRAIADYNEAIRLDPKDERPYISRGLTWSNKREYDRAIADCNEAIRLNPKNAWAYRSLAWILAKSAEAKYRNGPKAIELATTACELTDWKNAGPIDTLAVAYAVSGDFDKAVHWQTKAVGMVSTSDRPGYQRSLDLYRAGKCVQPAAFAILFTIAFGAWRLLLRFTRKRARCVGLV